MESRSIWQFFRKDQWRNPVPEINMYLPHKFGRIFDDFFFRDEDGKQLITAGEKEGVIREEKYFSLYFFDKSSTKETLVFFLPDNI